MAKSIREVLQGMPPVQASGGPAVVDDSVTGYCKPGCDICGGLGWYREDLPINHPDFGRLKRCPNAILLDTKRPELFGLSSQDLQLHWGSIKRVGALAEHVERIKDLFMSRSGFILLHGRPGTGKSLMLKVAVSVAVSSGWRARYANLSEILDNIRAAYDHERAMEELVERMERWSDLDILSIDEADKVSSTEWARERIFALLDRRYREALQGRGTTLVAVNSLEKLDDYLVSRFSDSRVGYVVDLNNARDLRPMAKKEWPR